MGDSDQAATTVVGVSTFYPLPDVQTHKTRFSFPYFEILLPHGTKLYQWQIHPVDDGPLRYTLVSRDRNSMHTALPAGHRDEDSVVAVYYHVGQVSSLFTSHSEGILLLPECGGLSLPEQTIVASLVGVLFRVRSMRRAIDRQGQGNTNPRGKSWLKKLVC